MIDPLNFDCIFGQITTSFGTVLCQAASVLAKLNGSRSTMSALSSRCANSVST